MYFSPHLMQLANDVRNSPAVANPGQAVSGSSSKASELRFLKDQVERQALMNQALWEILRVKLNLTDADLERMVHEVDMRDGVQDGEMTVTPVKCPDCSRTNNSRHAQCIYCGTLFQKPLWG